MKEYFIVVMAASIAFVVAVGIGLLIVQACACKLPNIECVPIGKSAHCWAKDDRK